MRDNADIKTISEAYISMLQESNKRPVKFNGRTFSNYKVFNSDKEANEFLEKNDDYGVIGEKGGKVYVAKKSDLGESRKTNYYEIGGDTYDETQLFENKNLMKDYQDLKDKGKRDSAAIDILMVMPKYRKMTRDQISKIIGDQKRKGVFKR